MLKKTLGSPNVDASRILGKGPEYLRRQIERESEGNNGRVSAVERLAASKPQYIKSQQVDGSAQEPASASEVSSNVHSSVQKATSVDAENEQTRQEETNVVRRISSKKRDSILLYRQKCELLKGTPGGSKRLIKKSLFSLKDKTNAFPEAQGDISELDYKKDIALCTTRKDCENDSTASTKFDPLVAPPHRRVAETRDQERKSRRGVARSSSDISSRYSKNFADFDAFFRYCGLDGDIIISMGKDNFSVRSDDHGYNIRSVSVSTSDDGLSRSSGHSDGRQEEESQETVRQGPSVIERNARIIKWLYSCRNAAESGKALRDLD
ncbi:protein FAM110C [Misgurnus anguillicaudatus]|uniref:protein FAM110C n=1 Tax=Misgurnus anguillicaudatus TaxID=75329 RepID=UPI003CCF6956